ncbi:unnamed protein product [Prorocentrum cordatum]|uniref:Uncharacterized protein n=1 Tax=Prorocentrum cordatum TaxID=2364126 RepID=A0ABN9TL62_9DINO|nr:unnamed protein product [Polarella glacialis]
MQAVTALLRHYPLAQAAANPSESWMSTLSADWDANDGVRRLAALVRLASQIAAEARAGTPRPRKSPVSASRARRAPASAAEGVTERIGGTEVNERDGQTSANDSESFESLDADARSGASADAAPQAMGPPPGWWTARAALGIFGGRRLDSKPKIKPRGQQAAGDAPPPGPSAVAVRGLLGPVADCFRRAAALDPWGEAVDLSRGPFLQGIEAYAAVLDRVGGNMGSYLLNNTRKLRTRVSAQSGQLWQGSGRRQARVGPTGQWPRRGRSASGTPPTAQDRPRWQGAAIEGPPIAQGWRTRMARSRHRPPRRACPRRGAAAAAAPASRGHGRRNALRLESRGHRRQIHAPLRRFVC